MEQKSDKLYSDDGHMTIDKEFDELFAQLDISDACAPINVGFHHLLAGIETMKQPQSRARKRY